MNGIPTKEDYLDALCQRHGAAAQAKFTNSTVAICGLGGLGSHIAVSLARAGIGNLILIDFDKVELSNLHRQQYKVSQIGTFKTNALRENLNEIAPYVTITAHTVRITEENLTALLGKADVICEAFDQAEEKAMLVNGVLEALPKTYLVAANGMAGFGPANLIQTKKITDHFYLCGDGKSEVSEHIGLISSRVMLCAAHQAHITLCILAEKM